MDGLRSRLWGGGGGGASVHPHSNRFPLLQVVPAIVMVLLFEQFGAVMCQMGHDHWSGGLLHQHTHTHPNQQNLNLSKSTPDRSLIGILSSTFSLINLHVRG